MRKLYAAALAAIFLFTLPALAQSQTPSTSKYNINPALLDPIADGSLTASQTGCTAAGAIKLRTDGVATVGVNVTGTFSATLTFKAAADNNITYNTVNAYPQSGALGAPVSTATAAGTWRIPAAGYKFVCVYASAYTSGTAVVHLEGDTATPADLVPPAPWAQGTRIQCQVAVSTATTIQAVGGSCAAPGAGLSIYITDITFATNAAGIAADSFNTLKSGTGGTCGAATAVIYQCFTTAATQATCEAHLQTPIKVTANNEVCWINSTAGSKTLNIEGFIAP